MEYDALLIATGLVHKFPAIEGLTIDEERDLRINLAENVFSPIRSKEQHIKFNTFMNKHTIKNLLVMGYNVESLEFIYALRKEFPDVKITVLDTQRDSQVSEHVGPEVEKAIIKEYTSRDVNFYIKIKDEIFYSNKFSYKNLMKEQNGELPKKKKEAKEKILKALKKGKGKDKEKEKAPEIKEEGVDPLLKYENSITARLADGHRIKADGVVFFPHFFSGNTVLLNILSIGCVTESTPTSITFTMRDYLPTPSVEQTTSVSSQLEPVQSMTTTSTRED